MSLKATFITDRIGIPTHKSCVIQICDENQQTMPYGYMVTQLYLNKEIQKLMRNGTKANPKAIKKNKIKFVKYCCDFCFHGL